MSTSHIKDHVNGVRDTSRMNVQNIKDHKRINDIWLGFLERPAIAWLVENMPLWVTPDHLTVVGLAGAVIIFVGYALSGIDVNFLWLANFGYLVSWFGDSLDGSLARFRKIERPRYGFFVDHTVDVVAEVLIFLGLGVSPFINLHLAFLTLVGYLMLSVLVYVTMCVRGEFQISYGGVGPTELRAAAVAANLCFYHFGVPLVSVPVLGEVALYDILVFGLALTLILVFFNSLLKQIRALALLEPPKASS